MKLIKFFVLSALSAGWLLPLYLAFNAFRGYLVTELEPKIVGKPLTHSFGMLDQCGIWLEIAFFWIACAIVFWVVCVLRLETKSQGKLRNQ